nr:hypothetical protein [Tanacetum cinerariifolium]
MLFQTTVYCHPYLGGAATPRMWLQPWRALRTSWQGKLLDLQPWLGKDHHYGVCSHGGSDTFVSGSALVNLIHYTVREGPPLWCLQPWRVGYLCIWFRTRKSNPLYGKVSPAEGLKTYCILRTQDNTAKVVFAAMADVAEKGLMLKSACDIFLQAEK